MKKLIAILISTILMLSIVGCNSNPSDNKIKKALDEGAITLEDAKAKGWIDEEWIKKNFVPIKASSKIHLFAPFETTYLNGTPASSKIIEGEMCLVFFNTNNYTTLEKLKIYNDAYDPMKEKGIPILGILTDENSTAAKEKLKDIKFPIILYNEEMQKSLDQYNSMIKTDVTSVFTREGGFYSAWQINSTVDSLLKYSEDLANEE